MLLTPSAPKVEIIREPYGDYMAVGLQIDRTRHIILEDGHYIRCVRRHVRMENLFLYWHTESKRCVIAGWTWPHTAVTAGICIELQSFLAPPLWETRDLPTLDFMAWRTRPVWQQAEENVAMMKERVARKLELRNQTNIERQDKATFLRHQGRTAEAKALSEGYTPFIGRAEGGADKLDEIRDRVSTIAKILEKR